MTALLPGHADADEPKGWQAREADQGGPSGSAVRGAVLGVTALLTYRAVPEGQAGMQARKGSA